MHHWRASFSHILATAIVALLSVAPSPASAGCGEYRGGDYQPPPLPRANMPYDYRGDRQALKDQLKFLAINLDIALELGKGVPDAETSQMPENLTVSEYLEYLARKYELVWFFDGSKLYVDGISELQMKVIPLQKENGSQVVDILKSMKLCQPKFQHQFDLQSHVFTVSGPPAYVDMVDGTVKAVETARRLDTQVFRGSSAHQTPALPTDSLVSGGNAMPQMPDLPATTPLPTGF